MGYYNYKKPNGYYYSNETIKDDIKNNEFVKNIRKKLMQKRLEQMFRK
jgi:hypothetical protein